MDQRPAAPGGAVVGTLIALTAITMACADSGTTVAVLDDAAASLTISIEGDATGSEQLILDVGDSVSLAATGTSVLGLAVQIGTVTWSSSDAAVALVESDGLLRAVGPGTVGVLASADGVSASLTAQVNDTVTAFP